MPGSDYGNYPLSDSTTEISVDEVVRSLRLQFEKSLIDHPVIIGDMRVSLTISATGQGGSRYWFICPHCASRVGKLYYHHPYIACRKCHRLKYRSSRYKGMVEGKTL